MNIFQLWSKTLLVFLGFDILVSSDIPRPRGVSLSRSVIYVPKETFLCEDGLKIVKHSQINDDFCDCADGSDEPGTPACSNGVFYCMNLGHRPSNIPSSRVNDGICDCCDASDEYNSSSKCVNNCMALGKEERQREKIRQELIKKGGILRANLINKGKLLKDERKKKLEELQNRKAEADEIREEKQITKKEAEVAENEALEVYREIQEADDREKQEKEANANRKDAEETFAKYDSNKDGFIEIVEIQTRVAFDKDRDGVVTIEEAKYFLDERDRVDLETFVTLGWPRIKPYLMLDSGLLKAPLSEDENMNEFSINQQYKISDDKYEEHENEDEEAPDADLGPHEAEEEEENDEHLNGDTETEKTAITSQEYDLETQKLIEQADAARTEYLEADRTAREIETEITNLEGLISKEYGLEEEYAPLDGECYTFDDREYVYKLYPFDRASQQSRSGGSETRLGTWDRWNGDNENKYSRMLYSNGASCWNGPQRSAVVNIECGLENKITSVTEPNRCEYQFIFQTPAACYSVEHQSEYDFHDEL